MFHKLADRVWVQTGYILRTSEKENQSLFVKATRPLNHSDVTEFSFIKICLHTTSCNKKLFRYLGLENKF